MSDEIKQLPEIETNEADKASVVSVAGAVDAKEEKPAKKVIGRRQKGKAVRQVALGRVYIRATYNNTIVSFTDQNGNVLAASSAGANGFSGPRKATPYAASVIVKKAAEKVMPFGLKEVNVFVDGVGLGREAAVRAINANGIIVLTIKDITPIPHNGCRRKKPRRV
jgi:small subunit ribosomal protein S11